MSEMLNRLTLAVHGAAATAKAVDGPIAQQIAIAVLRALQTPTESMVEAGYRADCAAIDHVQDTAWIAEIWQAMLKAALNEGNT